MVIFPPPCNKAGTGAPFPEESKMNRMTIVPLACLALAACNQSSVSLTNASPEEVARAAKASGTTIQMHPGQWETKIEMLSMDAPGLKDMPPQFAERLKEQLMKPRTITSCMSEEDAKRGPSRALTGDSKCKFEKYEMNGGSISAVMACPGPQGDMKMEMNGNFAADSFTVEQTMDMAGPTGTMHTKARASGKRIGDCPAGAK
jgi:hypothetical protein